MVSEARDTVALEVTHLLQAQSAIARLIAGMADRAAVEGDLDALMPLLTALPHEHPLISNVVVMDADGRVRLDVGRTSGTSPATGAGRLAVVGGAAWPEATRSGMTANALLVRSSEAGQSRRLVGVEQDLLDSHGHTRFQVYLLDLGSELPSAGAAIGRTWLIGDDGALLAAPGDEATGGTIAALSHSWRESRSERGGVGELRQPMNDGEHVLLYRQLEGWPAAVIIDAGLAVPPRIAPHNLAAALLLGLACLLVVASLVKRRWGGPMPPAADGLAVPSSDSQALARRLAAGVAHEVNNMLTVLAFDAEMLAVGYAHDPELRTLSGSMLGATERAAAMTQSLLCYSERAALRPRRLDLAAHLTQAFPTLSGALMQHQQLTLDLPPGDGAAICARLDPDALNDCLLALLRNAAEAARPNARIWLELRVATGAEASAQPVAMLAIIDSGGGMEPPILRHALEPGFSGKANGRHLGLGLSAAAGFARQSGGNLAVDSHQGQGTRVTLSLPMVGAGFADTAAKGMADADVAPPGGEVRAESAETWAGRPAGAGGPMTRHRQPAGARILVVDDSDQVRGSIGRRLRADGYIVREASTAAEAEAHVRAGVDVMVTDIVLDDAIDGFALAARARSIDPALPLVFISGFVSARQPELLAGDEFASFVRKPLHGAELHAVIDGLLALRESRRMEIAPLAMGPSRL